MSQAAARPAHLADIESIVAMSNDAASEIALLRGGQRLLATSATARCSSSSLNEDLSSADAMVWCGTWDDAVVGYAIARLLREGTLLSVRLTDLYTAAEGRDVGVGEAMLSAAIAWGIANDAEGIDAYALPGSRETKNLFERMGLTARLLTVYRDLR